MTLRSIVVVAFGLTCSALGTPQAPHDLAPPHVWSPRVAEALAAYRAGDYARAQRFAAELRDRADDPSAARDARLLEALCMLRSPERPSRNQGRVRLQQLADEDPVLADDPECQLAYGIALTALAETAEALDVLEQAAAGFAAAGPPDRRAEPLVALAEAWVRHGEWDRTPPRFAVQAPTDRARARAIRRAQLDALRERVRALPDHEDALNRVELVLAQHLLADEPDSVEAHAILSRLATEPPWSTTRAAAALALAEQLELARRWPDALRLYEQLRANWRGELMEHAERRLRDLTSARIEIDLPRAAPVGRPGAARVRARGVDDVEFDVRHVDLDEWLRSTRSRGQVHLLPESGSVKVTRRLDARTPGAHELWHSDDLPLPPEAGAYVVLARGTARNGSPCQAKDLLIVSDLRAACVVGPTRMALFGLLAPADGVIEPPQVASAQFWMTRSFAPTRTDLHDGVALLPVPNEARVMRDKAWLCLFRAGPHLALCRGDVPATASSETAPRVALSVGPATVQAGGVLHVAGLLWPTLPEPTPGATVRVEVADVYDRPIFQRDVALAGGGAFHAAVPVPAALSGQHLRASVRYAGQTLENIAKRAVASVPVLGRARFEVDISTVRWLPETPSRLEAEVLATYPWGIRPAGNYVSCTFRPVQLPTTEGNDAPLPGLSLRRNAELDRAGRASFGVGVDEFALWPQPLAVFAEARVQSWEGRMGTANGEVLLAPQQPHVWLRHTPRQPVVGGALRFEVGWFQPGGLVLEAPPQVRITHAGHTVAELPTRAQAGAFLTDLWCPAEPGSYDVRAVLHVLDAPAIDLAKQVVVEAASPSAASAPNSLRCVAHVTSAPDLRRMARVTLEGHSDTPLLVVLRRGDPLAAHALPRLAGLQFVDFELDAGPPPPPAAAAGATGLSVDVLGIDADGFTTRAQSLVAPDPQQTPALTLQTPDANCWPGELAQVRVTCQPAPPGTTLLARLVNAASVGFSLAPTPEVSDSHVPRSAPLTLASSTGRWSDERADADHGLTEPEDSARDTARALLSEGEALWVTSAALEAGTTELRVPVPAAAGIYRLVLLARTPDGHSATTSGLLDARRGVRTLIDAPEHLMLGDRCVLAVNVANDGPRPLETEIRIDGGAGIKLESGRLNYGARSVSAADLERGIPATVPAAGHIWLHLDFEAARVGPAEASVTVRAEERAQSATQSYEVVAEHAPADSPVAATIQRSVSAWVRDPNEIVVDHHDGEQRPRAKWVPLSPDQRLLPGQLLKVSETVTFKQPLSAHHWTQFVPANCRTTTLPAPGALIGTRRSDRLDALVYAVDALPAGARVHEYFLAVVRPGAALLPPPQLRRGDELIPVAVSPAEFRVIAAEAE